MKALRLFLFGAVVIFFSCREEQVEPDITRNEPFSHSEKQIATADGPRYVRTDGD